MFICFTWSQWVNKFEWFCMDHMPFFMKFLAVLWSLTHWGRVTHICVSDLTSIGSDNGLSPGRRQAIIRTNAGILLIRPLGTNFSEFLVKILIFSFKKMRLKVSSAKRRPFCLGLNELTYWGQDKMITMCAADILKCVFLNENFWMSYKNSLKCNTLGSISQSVNNG